ncbi:MAG TPA: UPF0280 family protein [Candidatus Cybelea sp.]|nr:UPF0280 family protein [Candidatus Cybelea sp.]
MREKLVRRLADGRLLLQDGPIDLIIEAVGESARAYGAAAQRFDTILDALCSELPLLRTPAREDSAPQGAVARRMWNAVLPFSRDRFITPMAAVAGSVAEEVLAAMTETAALRRAYVNDGGDIAVFLAPGECLRIGLVDRPDRPSLFGSVELRADQPARGIATSGWRGRSFSLGIADAVTVLADCASGADAAATLIANAVDIPGHPAITRRPAIDLDPQSDLQDRLVTVAVDGLDAVEINTALAAGCRVAEDFLGRGLIRAAALHLAGETRTVDGAALLRAA